MRVYVRFVFFLVVVANLYLCCCLYTPFSYMGTTPFKSDQGGGAGGRGKGKGFGIIDIRKRKKEK